MPDPSTPITWGLIGSLGTATLGLGALVIKGWPIFRRFEQFFTDWAGEPARPGVDAKPGVMARLAALEGGQEETNRQQEETNRQLAALAAADVQRAALVEDHEHRIDHLEHSEDTRRAS